MNDMVLTRADEAPLLNEQDNSVTSLVRMAIERKVDVEVLERLVALQERVTERDAATAFVAALAAFRDECPPITKTRENTQFKVTRNGAPKNAKYAPLEEIDRVARPVAAKHGLVWTWDTSVDENLMHITCRLTHVLGHSVNTNVSMPYESKAGSSPQQKYGSTQMYGMRYSLIAALGITTVDEDLDGASAAAEVETITDGQAADLDALIEDVGADKARFLKWIGFPSLEEIPVTEYARAVDAVEAKRVK